MSKEEVRERIDDSGSEPSIRGTDVRVAAVIEGLAEGLSIEQVIERYPKLTRADVKAALQFAADLARGDGGGPPPAFAA